MKSVNNATANDDDDNDDDDDDGDAGCLVRVIINCQNAMHSLWRRFGKHIKLLLYVTLVVVYFAYFAYAMYYHFGDEGSIRLLWVTSLVVVCMALKLAYDCCRKHVRRSMMTDWPIWTFVRDHIRFINWLVSERDCLFPDS